MSFSICRGTLGSLAMLSVHLAEDVGASRCDVRMSDDNGRKSDDDRASVCPNAAHRRLKAQRRGHLYRCE
jgi:hypothetical protein